jgi:tRNA nucleotidyltransferase (CCA-adding enzyme)
LINNAVKMNLFGKSDDPRFFSELKILLNEDHGVSAILRLEELGLFPYLWPDLKPHLTIDQRFDLSLKQAQQAISWFKLLYLEDTFEPWMVYLLTMMGRSPVTVLINFCNRFQLAPKIKNYLINEKNLADKTAAFLARRKHLKNSEIFTALRDLNIEGLLYLIAIARKSEVKQAVSSYVTSLRLQQPLLNGGDLKDLGYRPGPIFKTLLETLLLARLDEKVSTRQEEIELLTRQHPPPAAQ